MSTPDWRHSEPLRSRLLLRHIEAVMLWPADPPGDTPSRGLVRNRKHHQRQEMLERYTSLRDVQRELEAGSVTMSPADVSQFITQALAVEDLEKLLRATRHRYWLGWIAGATLIGLLSNKGKVTIDDFRTELTDTRHETGKALAKLRIGKSTIRDAWPQYRSVAHLWACHLSSNLRAADALTDRTFPGWLLRGDMVLKNIGDQSFVVDPDDLEDFLDESERLRSEGEALKLSRSTATALVPGESWQAPQTLKTSAIEQSLRFF